MTTHIHEDSTGVCMRVEYLNDGQGIEFVDVRVLDSNYLPVGPDLRGMLHNLVYITTNTDSGEVMGTRFLATIVQEIEK
jgi:hypothetical protein